MKQVGSVLGIVVVVVEVVVVVAAVVVDVLTKGVVTPAFFPPSVVDPYIEEFCEHLKFLI